MPLLLKKAPKKTPATTPQAEAPEAVGQDVQAPWEGDGAPMQEVKKSKLASMATPPEAKAAKPSVSGLLKKGKQAHVTLEEENRKAEIERKNRSQTFRWFMKPGESKPCLFLDGDLDGDGLLDIPFVYEHQLYDKYAQVKFRTRFCTQDIEPCPVCEGGDTPQYIGFLTVIDINGYTDKEGKHHPNQKRLMPVKRDTFKQLQMMATKREGLAGCVFDVSRVGDKSASVGSNFDFTQKLTYEELVEELGEELANPIDYADMIEKTYLTAAELRKEGFGSAPGVGGETDPASYDDKL